MRQIIYILISTVLVGALFTPFGINPRFGNLLLYPLSPMVIHDRDGEHVEMDLPYDDDLWIGFDSLGIPHIQCKNETTAAYATGYLHARDRLFQIEMIRRQILGRLTEVAGEKAMSLDRFWRKFSFANECSENIERIKQQDKEMFDVYQAYADGVNAYIEQMEHTDLPLEFRLLDFKPMPFEPWHCLLLSKSMCYDLGYEEDDMAFSHIKNELPQELIDLYYPWVSPRAFPVYPDLEFSDSQFLSLPSSPLKIYQTTTAFHGAKFFKHENYSIGSNNWIAGPKRTATGNPILCDDTHLKLRVPSIWYELVITTGTGMRRGFSVPSNPLMLIGFNENLAWGETNATWDLVDYYHLDINPSGETYALDGKQEPLIPYTETFKVKGGDDIQVTYYESYFGPVDTLYGEVLATAWVGTVSANDGAAFYGLQKARSVEEGAEAVWNFKAPAQNFALADRHGNFGLVTAGVAARHKTKERGIIHGTKSSDRMEFVAMNSILRDINPEKGWVASANQNHVKGEAGSWLNHRFLPTSRSRRIAELLSDSVLIDPDYMAAMQTDILDEEWSFMREKILKNCPEDWKKYLETWDGRCDTGEIAPTLFVAFKRELCQLFFNELSPGLALDPQEELVVWLFSTRDTLPLKDGIIVVDTFYKKVFESTAHNLKDYYDDSDIGKYNYGQYHMMHIRHITGIAPLGAEAKPAAGSDRTINVAAGFPTTTGPSMRLLVEMTPEGPNGWMTINGGQSGWISSTNYTSQMESFRQGKYHKAPLMEQFQPDQFIATLHFKKQ